MKAKKRWKSLTASAVAAAMVLPGAVLAEETDPKAELQAILEATEKQQGSSLLMQDLNLNALWDAMDETGFRMTFDLGLTDSTLTTLGLEGMIPADIGFGLEAALDTVQKKWMFEAALLGNGSELGDFSLYADQDLFALASEALYSSAVAIRSGSFLEQFEGSALAGLMEYEGGIPDFDLKFYLEDAELDSLKLFDYEAYAQEQADYLEEQMRVEKVEAEDITLYTMYIPTDAVTELQKSLMDQYMSLFQQMGVMDAYELESFYSEYDTTLNQMKVLLGEEIAVDYYIQDGGLLMISYALTVDPAAMEAQMEDMDSANPAADFAETPVTEIVEGTLVSSDPSVQTSEEEGFQISYDILFADPADPYANFDMVMLVQTLSGVEQAGIVISKTAQRTEDSEGNVVGESAQISISVSEYEEELYNGTPLWYEYNAQTGDLDAAFVLEDEYETIALRLDSTLEKEEGKSVSWRIDGLTLEAEGEAAGLKGTLTLTSDPGAIEGPQNPKMILEMDEGALMGALTELSYNLEKLEEMLTGEEVY